MNLKILKTAIFSSFSINVNVMPQWTKMSTMALLLLTSILSDQLDQVNNPLNFLQYISSQYFFLWCRLGRELSTDTLESNIETYLAFCRHQKMIDLGEP